MIALPAHHATLELIRGSDGKIIEAQLRADDRTTASWIWTFPPNEVDALTEGRARCKEIFGCVPRIIRRGLR